MMLISATDDSNSIGIAGEGGQSDLDLRGRIACVTADQLAEHVIQAVEGRAQQVGEALGH